MAALLDVSDRVVSQLRQRDAFIGDVRRAKLTAGDLAVEDRDIGWQQRLPCRHMPFGVKGDLRRARHNTVGTIQRAIDTDRQTTQDNSADLAVTAKRQSDDRLRRR